MDALRKEAYRHLIYAAMLDMRILPPQPRWWSLSRWREVYSETARVKDLAHAFHNVALYSRRDFEGFDEAMFWRDLDWSGVRWMTPLRKSTPRDSGFMVSRQPVFAHSWPFPVHTDPDDLETPSAPSPKSI